MAESLRVRIEALAAEWGAAKPIDDPNVEWLMHLHAKRLRDALNATGVVAAPASSSPEPTSGEGER